MQRRLLLLGRVDKYDAGGLPARLFLPGRHGVINQHFEPLPRGNLFERRPILYIFILVYGVRGGQLPRARFHDGDGVHVLGRLLLQLRVDGHDASAVSSGPFLPRGTSNGHRQPVPSRKVQRGRLGRYIVHCLRCVSVGLLSRSWKCRADGESLHSGLHMP